MRNGSVDLIDGAVFTSNAFTPSDSFVAMNPTSVSRKFLPVLFWGVIPLWSCSRSSHESCEFEAFTLPSTIVVHAPFKLCEAISADDCVGCREIGIDYPYDYEMPDGEQRFVEDLREDQSPFVDEVTYF